MRGPTDGARCQQNDDRIICESRDRSSVSHVPIAWEGQQTAQQRHWLTTAPSRRPAIDCYTAFCSRDQQLQPPSQAFRMCRSHERANRRCSRTTTVSYARAETAVAFRMCRSHERANRRRSSAILRLSVDPEGATWGDRRWLYATLPGHRVKTALKSSWELESTLVYFSAYSKHPNKPLEWLAAPPRGFFADYHCGQCSTSNQHVWVHGEECAEFGAR